MKDAICPYCGRSDIFSPLNINYNQFSFDLEEDLTNINLNKNINNIINIDFDSKFRPNTREYNITSINSAYSIEEFNFFITNEKKSTNIIKNDKIEIINNYKKVKGSKKLGRKIKRNNLLTLEEDYTIKDNSNKKVHDRFTDDNMRKKCKNIILKCLFEFINNKIKLVYKNDIGHGLSEKNLKILNQKAKNKATFGIDREFMNKKLKEIFSQDISSRFCNYPLDHNKKVINSLINENDKDKRNNFENLFNLTFRDCLTFFRGDKKDFKELEGLKNLEYVKQHLMKENGEEYANHFVYYIKNYENIINKRSKKFLKTLEESKNN